MEIKKHQQDLFEALENAYKQLIKALNEKLDPKEVDPEKRKTALALYRQAADDAGAILNQMREIGGILEVNPEDVMKKQFLGVEDILKK